MKREKNLFYYSSSPLMQPLYNGIHTRYIIQNRLFKVKTTKKLVSILLLIMTVSPVITMAAEIIIKVTDENEPVPMTEIILIDAKNSLITNNGFTNKLGIYRYSVKPGLYKVIVTKEEFSDVTIRDIKIKNSNINKTVELIPRAFDTDKEASSDDDCD